jgi:hypothetical protein
MSLNRKEIRPGDVGYFPKNQNRYRYCNAFHDEGLRCTRHIHHKGPHAAHYTLGIPDTIDPETGNIREGTINSIDVQIATW